jgi:hypothetical protein
MEPCKVKPSRYQAKTSWEAPHYKLFHAPGGCVTQEIWTGLNYHLCQTGFKAVGLTIRCGTSGRITNCRQPDRSVRPAHTRLRTNGSNGREFTPGGCEPQGLRSAAIASGKNQHVRVGLTAAATCGPADSAKTLLIARSRANTVMYKRGIHARLSLNNQNLSLGPTSNLNPLALRNRRVLSLSIISLPRFIPCSAGTINRPPEPPVNRNPGSAWPNVLS